MAKTRTGTGTKAPELGTVAPMRSKAGPRMSPEERQRMIAEAAYYLAEHRGFQGGDPVHDWLQAEAEIDRRLNPAH